MINDTVKLPKRQIFQNVILFALKPGLVRAILQRCVFVRHGFAVDLVVVVLSARGTVTTKTSTKNAAFKLRVHTFSLIDNITS